MLTEHPDSIYGWTLLGDAQQGSSQNDRCGWKTRMTPDGSRVATSCLGAANNAGQVRVYEYSASQGSWSLLGNAINGEASLDGANVLAISDGGSFVLVGSYAYDCSFAANCGKVGSSSSMTRPMRGRW